MENLHQRIQKFSEEIEQLKDEIKALKEECEYWKNQWNSYFRVEDKDENEA